MARLDFFLVILTLWLRRCGSGTSDLPLPLRLLGGGRCRNLVLLEQASVRNAVRTAKGSGDVEAFAIFIRAREDDEQLATLLPDVEVHHTFQTPSTAGNPDILGPLGFHEHLEAFASATIRLRLEAELDGG